MVQHDFKNFPELTDNQMELFYFKSPHKQITEDFKAKVVKVIDGDTIRVKTNFRDFDFPVRFLDVAAPELKEGGRDSQKWLEKRIMGEEIMIEIDKENRVGKWGRLLGRIIWKGLNMNQAIINAGKAVRWEERNNGVVDINKMLKEIKRQWH